MEHITCIIISCTIMYIYSLFLKVRIMNHLKMVMETSAEWVIEDRKRINKVVKDINKYYAGVEYPDNEEEI